MASASVASTLLVPATSAGSSAPACPSKLSKKTAVSRRRHTVSCRAIGGGRGDDGLLWLPRRDVLTGLTGVAAGLVGYPDLASIALEVNPDVDSCPRGAKVTDKFVECTDPDRKYPCPPSTRVPIVDFKPEGKVKRVRQPAHLLTREYQEKYKEAIAKMKALPASNPMSFVAQAAIHEAYCDGHYRYDPAKMDKPFDVHFSWIFAPWHRMYLYFYERALGQLIGDDTFALPYWNWDTPAGMGIPAIFNDSFANPLYDKNRNQSHRDKLIDLDYLNSIKAGVQPVSFKRTPENAAAYDQAVQKNLCTVYQQQIRVGKGPRAYLGEKLCSEASLRIKELKERSKGQDGAQITPSPSASQGTLEQMAHTTVHVWVGRANPKGSECTDGVLGHDGQVHCANDMGFLGTAGRDPLFYSHHANVDRMWHIWSTKLGGNGFDDPEWLDASFVFYDDVDKQRLVRIKFRDVLDARDLGYTYDAQPLPWMKSKPTRLGKGSSARSKQAAPEFPLTLSKDQILELPSVPVPAKEGGKALVLVIEGIEYDPQTENKFDVAINLSKQDALKLGPQHIEYAGGFNAVPSSKVDGGTLLGKITLFIDDVLAELGASGDSTIDVTLVPRSDGEIKIYLPPTIQNA